MRLRLALAALAAVFCLGASAADPSERLPNPAQEARARALFKDLRCVVCQNEALDDSQADLAADLRSVIRRQIAQGRTDSQVKAYLVSRYGEFVLLQPSFSAGNALLWLAPLGVILLGGVYLLLQARRPKAPEASLSPEEEHQVLRLVKDDPATVRPQKGPRKG